MVPVSSAGGFSVANPALEGLSSSLEARGAYPTFGLISEGARRRALSAGGCERPKPAREKKNVLARSELNEISRGVCHQLFHCHIITQDIFHRRLVVLGLKSSIQNS